jgi:hypothetical protein
MYVYHYAEHSGFATYIVGHHIPDKGMILMLTKQNGNELTWKYFIIIITTTTTATAITIITSSSSTAITSSSPPPPRYNMASFQCCTIARLQCACHKM